MSGHLSKCETCPECKAELSQHDYDMQACPCGWGPFGVPSKPKQEGNILDRIRLKLMNDEARTGFRALLVEIGPTEYAELVAIIGAERANKHSGITVCNVVLLAGKLDGIHIMRSATPYRAGVLHL